MVKQMQVTDENSILDETFGHLTPSASVPPQLALQLQALIAEAVAPLQERIAILEDGQDATLREEVIRLQVALQEERDARHRAVQDLEELNDLRALEIGQDRRRIAALEVPPEVHVQPKQRNQGDILRALLATTPRGKMLQKVARQKMGISKSAFSRLIGTLGGTVKKEPYHRDRRQNILILIDKKS